eukprot:9234568-Pyramimonas_sp.AAC.1
MTITIFSRPSTKGLRGLVWDGILPSIGDSSPAAAAAAISAKLEQLHAAHKETRLQEWRRRQQEGNMKAIFTYVSLGRRPSPLLPPGAPRDNSLGAPQDNSVRTLPPSWPRPSG